MSRRHERKWLSIGNPPLTIIKHKSSRPRAPKSAKRVTFGKPPPIRERLRAEARITVAVLSAWLAGRSMDGIYRIAKRKGFRGRQVDVWFILQRGTGWPEVLWNGRAGLCATKRGVVQP